MISAGDVKAAMAAFPFAPLHAVTSGRPVLILAPHADDESLGCGGLIAASVAMGVLPMVLIVTDGSKSHPNSPSFPPARLIATREQETRNAVATLGLPAHRLKFLRSPDAGAPTAGPAFDLAVQSILETAAYAGAETILAPWAHDPHCDHEATHLMAESASSQSGSRRWAYPVWGWTLLDDCPLPGPLPDGVRVRIGQFIHQKREAIAKHATQYSDLINDDPAGFRLPPELLSVFDHPYETFIRLT